MPRMVLAVRLVHGLYVAFVLTAPLWLLYGSLARVRSLTSPVVRVGHAAAVAFVGLQAALGWPCPLTWLEQALAGTPDGGAFLPEPSIPAWATAVGVTLYLGLSGAGHLAAWRTAEAPR